MSESIRTNNVNGLCTDLPVILLYNLDRRWGAEEKKEIIELANCLENGLVQVGHPTISARLEDQDLEKVMKAFDPRQHIVFNWCEEVPGLPHSSPQVARTLDEMGFVYTGADAQALQFSHDKPGVKEKLILQKVPTPCWQVCETADTNGWDSFPAIVKPATEHCSFGINGQAVVHDRAQLQARVAGVIDEFHQPALVEDFIDGREFHVTVVGNGRLQAFPIAEMDFSAIDEDSRRLCSYDSKFDPDSNDYQSIQLRLPAALTAREQGRLEEVAIGAFRATGCRDYARMDIRLRDGIFYVLDVNPNADISPDTSICLSAELAGYSYGEFGSLLVNLAAKRHPLLARQVLHHARQSLPVMASAG